MTLRNRFSWKISLAFVVAVCSTSALAQQSASGTAAGGATNDFEAVQLQQGWGFGGLPVDWSFSHILYTAHYSHSQIAHMQDEPRAHYQWLLQGHKPGSGQSSATLAASVKRPSNKRPVKPHRDWSLSLGSGTVAQNMFPAKFNFDFSGNTPSCANDFVVFGLNVASSASQANLVGVNNLYSGTGGTCTGATVNWAYRASTSGGKITTSPILSLDGTKVAFVESTGSASILHVLAWKASNGTVASPATPTTVTSVSGCTTPCMSTLTYDGSHGTTLSSPFYNYQGGTDTLYIGNDNGQLFKITGVFSGTPTVSTSGGWSASGVTVASGVKLTAPVLDFNSGNLFIGGSDGNLYSVSSTAPATQSHIAVGSGSANGGGIVDAPTIDSSNGTVLAYAGANAVNVAGTSLAVNSTAVVVQTTTSLGSPQAATIGQGTLGSTALNVVSGTFDNTYFNWNGSGANTGHFYAIGTASVATSPTLYQIPYSGVASVAVNTNGAGYTTPAVSFSGGGGGSGAAATASGGVTGYAIGTNTGTFNTSNATTAAIPAVGVSAPTGPNPVTASATTTYNLAAVSLGSAAGSRCVAGAYNINGGVSGTADTISITTGASNAVNGVTFTGNGRVYNSVNAPSSPTTCPSTVNIASATSPGSLGANKATVTTSTANGFVTGDSVTIAGVTCGGGTCSPAFNGTWTITVTSSTKFTFTQCSFCFGDTADNNTGTVTDSNAAQPNFNWQLKLNTITANVAGSGYTGAPSVTFSSPAPTGTVNVSATINVTNVALTYGGGGYSSAPTVTISGGTTAATATATINAGSVMTPGTSPTTAVVSGTSAVQASPITEIFTNALTDLLFYGYGSSGVGDIAAQNVTNGSISTPTLVAEPNATAGTSAVVVDNISTLAQASSIYFATQATSNNCGTGVFCAVKLTQSGLQ